MKKSQILKIILICLAALILGIVIILSNRIRANQAKVNYTDEVPVTGTSDEESTPEPEKEVTKAPEVSVSAALKKASVFTETEDNVLVSANKVNLRVEASSTSEVVAEVSKSTLLKRTGIADEWSRVVYHSQTCYVSNEFITDQVPEVTTSGVDDPDSAGTTSDVSKVVIVDPGHQGKGDNTREPIGPNASSTKARVTSGTSGSVSDWNEYELNLAVSLQLRDALVKRGYTVYMTRESHDVSISNKERAEFATAKGGDILVRIHANGSDNGSVNGALCMAPTNSNPFL